MLWLIWQNCVPRQRSKDQGGFLYFFLVEQDINPTVAISLALRTIFRLARRHIAQSCIGRGLYLSAVMSSQQHGLIMPTRSIYILLLVKGPTAQHQSSGSIYVYMIRKSKLAAWTFCLRECDT